MKIMIMLIALLSLEVSTPSCFAKTTKLPTLSYIRPYQPPYGAAILYERLTNIEGELGQTRNDFEYSLPKNSELIINIVFSKNGILDKSASATFHVSAGPFSLSQRNSGFFSISRLYPEPHNPGVHNSWYVNVNDHYGYGFSEGTPDNYMYTASEEENKIVGKAIMQERTVFAYRDLNRKFSIVVRVKCVPAPLHSDPLADYIRRDPLK